MDTEARARRAFAARLQEAMRENDLSQTALALRLGISQSTVSDWVSSVGAVPTFDVLMRLCEALGVSADWLMMGRGGRRGALPSVPESYGDGGLAAFREMRSEIERLEAKWRGGSGQGGEGPATSSPSGEVPGLPTSDELRRARELSERQERIEQVPGIRRRRRRRA